MHALKTTTRRFSFARSHLYSFLGIMVSMMLLSGSTAMAKESNVKTAMFAGGCFWCMQPAFDNVDGVVATSVGYSGGDAATATYEQVSTGTTKHREVIQVTYNPAKVSYATLVSIYFENVDPTQADGQFADRGEQYRTAIYYADAEQRAQAEKTITNIAKKFAPQPIKVSALPATPFYAAEEYHQKYYAKNSMHYTAYKVGSGRADFLEKTWGKKTAQNAISHL